MKRWVALGWIASAGFFGSAFEVVRSEVSWGVPIFLDATTVLVIWIVLFLLREFLDES